ncbi:hypothetical protein [Peptoniphilus indolicus]|uniref:Uncharacterized protein n=2 Tax=Peptoniphilus indolicus TaxID=33030 RepID=G4D589_9FIRM|nr:hypothetical protein [Peptoniphilus indolicus]EGY79307.1 hypothetical protein HMPREF9129_1569 [Peptoniphilus indolicus ATCC 29427]SUB74303.1 Uncharacterised protein [Peptoniphilus indolicus]
MKSKTIQSKSVKAIFLAFIIIISSISTVNAIGQLNGVSNGYIVQIIEERDGYIKASYLDTITGKVDIVEQYLNGDDSFIKIHSDDNLTTVERKNNQLVIKENYITIVDEELVLQNHETDNNISFYSWGNWNSWYCTRTSANYYKAEAALVASITASVLGVPIVASIVTSVVGFVVSAGPGDVYYEICNRQCQDRQRGIYEWQREITAYRVSNYTGLIDKYNYSWTGGASN